MSTVLREDHSLEAQADARHTEDHTLVHRVDDAVPLPDSEADELPIAKWLLSHDRATTNAPAAQATSAPSTKAPEARGLPVAVLTSDALFAGQVRSALESQHDVSVVDKAEGITELALAHRCPILITDAAITRSSIEALAARIRAHDSGAAIVVSGSRDQGGMLISLQSSGAIDGFLLKPVTAAATQLVIDAATRRYRSQETPITSSSRVRAKTRSPRTHRSQTHRPAAAVESPTIEVKCEPRAIEHPVAASAAAHKQSEQATHRGSAIPRASWPIVAIVALAVAASTWWAMSQRQPEFSAQELVNRHLALAEQAKQAHRLLDPRDGAVHHYQSVLAIDANNIAALRGLDLVAFELSREAQTYMASRRIADAALSLARLRELQPSYPELPLLDQRLQQLQEIVARESVVTEAGKAQEVAVPAAPRERPNVARTEPAPPVRAERIAPQKAEVANDTAPPAVVASIPVAVVPPATHLEPPTTSDATPPAAAPVTSPSVLPASPNAESKVEVEPKLAHYVAPEYPKEARLGGFEGWVRLSLRLAPNGQVLDARIESAEKRSLFGKAALAAVRRWRYEPGTFSTEPDARVLVRVNFKLES